MRCSKGFVFSITVFRITTKTIAPINYLSNKKGLTVIILLILIAIFYIIIEVDTINNHFVKNYTFAVTFEEMLFSYLNRLSYKLYSPHWLLLQNLGSHMTEVTTIVVDTFAIRIFTVCNLLMKKINHESICFWITSVTFVKK